MFDQRSWHCWYCLVHSHQKVICFLFFYFTKSVYRLETCDPIKRSFSGITTPRTVFFLLFSSYCFLLYWCVCVCVCVYIYILIFDIYFHDFQHFKKHSKIYFWRIQLLTRPSQNPILFFLSNWHWHYFFQKKSK
jgi:hypothetical protein